MSTPSSPDRSGEAFIETSSIDEQGNVIDAPARPSIVPAPGMVVAGTYRVERELGRGGMGVVYRARDTWLDRTVALKLIVPTWDDMLAEQKLQHEAKALATLRDQHVVQVYAFGRHGSSYFFAMEYVEGRSLEAILDDYQQRKSLLPQHRALTILGRIADGLDAAHARGIVHRDVKPGNIVIEEDTGRPVLIDFGLAQQSTDPNPETIEGTPLYMAPEQAGFGAHGITVGPWSDLYALGCVAFQLLTGSTPYPMRNMVHLLQAHQRAPVPLASSVHPELAPFDAVLARALAKNPADRYPSCGAFARDLVRVGSPKAAAAPSSEAPPPSTRQPGESSLRPLRVLAVDDDPAFGKFAAKAAELALKGRSVRIRVARSGQAALDAAREEPPDLLLLDLDMPDLDGVDTLSHLRALPRGDHARVVVLSGRVGPQERWKFAVLGVREFVAKPIDLRRLVDTIDGIVERAGWGAAPTA
ncbi:protein kinase domain-containing protein [Polyangium fumosum]|uniref:Response regulator n=1 Tax=Polyangium fumosum TaxID=889272 RepID=A0A4U1JIA6_9BACT|nr:protein kinase [Polyangium fumosum]TKD12380.1 response regulator [Polyangium fumosum]